MKSRHFRVAGVGNVLFAICLPIYLGLGISAGAQNLQIIKFDAPNSGTGANQGTASSAINLFGAIVGNVTDNDYNTHGFVRLPSGAFEEFDAPAANPLLGGTYPISINDLGIATGYALDGNGVSHGFLRTAGGTIIQFDDANAGTTPNQSQGTFPASINDWGAIVGNYTDTNGVNHGFLRSVDGELTTIDVPGTGTYPEQVNNFGVISGFYTDASFQGHGFLRSPEGNVTTFDPPAGPAGTIGTYGALINDAGAIAGYYIDTNIVCHGFLRSLDGNYSTFEARTAGTAPYNFYTAGTFVTAVNFEGATTGFVVNQYAETHSWVRDSNGKITTFSVPGQIVVPGNDYGSYGFGINALGIITGNWYDTNYALHGYTLVPCQHGCFEDDEATTATTSLSPATISPVDPAFPVMLNPKLRPMPWYRSFGAQPAK
jgi:hypothetical protein